MDINHLERADNSRLWFKRLVPGAVLLAILCACGGKPFNVRPRPSLPESAYQARGEAEGLTIQAEALTDEDLLYETFDANLILAGILPVRIKMINSRADEFSVKKARFEIRSPGGAAYRAVDPRKAYKQLVSYYGITVYRKDAYRQSQQDFASYALDTAKTLSSGETREGILFFVVPGELAVGGNFTLLASALGPNRSKAVVELKL